MCAEHRIKRSELKRESRPLCCVFHIITSKDFHKRRQRSQHAFFSQVCLCLCSIIVKEVQFDKRHPTAIDIWIAAANVSYWLQFETLTRDLSPISLKEKPTVYVTDKQIEHKLLLSCRRHR